MGRSILAIALGFVTVVILSLGADAALRGLGVFPAEPSAMSGGLFALATLYRAVFTGLGGALTGLLTPRPDQRDVRVLAGAGVIAGLGGVAAWFAAPGLGPLWYALLIPITGAIAALIGGGLAQAVRQDGHSCPSSQKTTPCPLPSACRSPAPSGPAFHGWAR